jgi:hypothetical protein
LSWGRTLLALAVVDLFVWRTWAISGFRLEGSFPNQQGGILAVDAVDYLGICALTAAAATVVLGVCVRNRSRQLRHSATGPPPYVMLSATAAVVALAGATVAAIALGR